MIRDSCRESLRRVSSGGRLNSILKNLVTVTVTKTVVKIFNQRRKLISEISTIQIEAISETKNIFDYSFFFGSVFKLRRSQQDFHRH